MNSKKNCCKKNKILRWLVCCGVTLHTILRMGLIYCFGMFLAQFKLQFQSSMGILTWISCTSVSLGAILAPLPVMIRSRIKNNGNQKLCILATVVMSTSCFVSSFVTHPIWLMLTIGVFYGVALCFASLSSSMVLMEFFPKNHKHHILASTFLYSGYSLASLVFNPLSNFFITHFSWQSTFRLIGSILLFLGVPVACIFKDNNAKNKEKVVSDEKLVPEVDMEIDLEREIITSISNKMTQQQKKNKNLKSFIKNENKNKKIEAEKKENGETKTDKNLKKDEKSFVKVWGDLWMKSLKHPEIFLWWMGNFFSQILYLVPFLILPHYMKKNKLEEEKVSLVMVVMSLGEWIIYMLVAFLGKYLEGRLVLASIFSSALISILYFVWSLVSFSFFLSFTFALIYGTLIAINSVFSFSCSAEVTHLPLVLSWSSTCIFSGIGSFVAPSFSGMIYDIRNDYSDLFLSMALCALVASFLFLMAGIFSNITSKKNLVIQSD